MWTENNFNTELFENARLRYHNYFPVECYSNKNRKLLRFLIWKTLVKTMIIWCVFIGIGPPFFKFLRSSADAALHVIHCFYLFSSLRFALLFFPLVFGALLFILQIMEKLDTIVSVCYYRSEEREFENFMRAFFGQFAPDRERFQGPSKPQKRRRKKKHWKIASTDHEDYRLLCTAEQSHLIC